MHNTSIDESCEVYCIHPELVRKAKTRELGDKAVQRLSEIFKTMGDPTRLSDCNEIV